MVAQEAMKLAHEIFKIDPRIVHLGLIDLEGRVLLDQSSSSLKPMEPDDQRVMFYYQVGLRRSRREHFDEAYGQTTYVHVKREKMQQLILYLPMLTVYLTLDESITPDGIKEIAEKIQNIDKDAISQVITSHMFYASNVN